MTDVCNYADDTTFHACDLDLKSLITGLEHDAALAVEWFESNYMMLNQDKCHFLFSRHKYETLFVNVGKVKIWESKQQNIFGALIDRDLKFDEYVLSLYKKAGKNHTALIRISKFMTFAQRRKIIKAFIESQFVYCPLVWMFCGRQTNTRINHIHERALIAVYNDEVCLFKELLERDKSKTIHRKNIKILAAELFKIKNDLWNDIMAQLICKRKSVGHILRSQKGFLLPQVKFVNYGLIALRYFGPKIWNILPTAFSPLGRPMCPHKKKKILKTLEHFENSQKKVKSWIPRDFPCRICENYIYRKGFTNTHNS